MNTCILTNRNINTQQRLFSQLLVTHNGWKGSARLASSLSGNNTPNAYNSTLTPLQYRNGIYVLNNNNSSSLALSFTEKFKKFNSIQNDITFQQTLYYYSTTSKKQQEEDQKTNNNNNNNNNNNSHPGEPQSLIVYEGPFASLAKRLKRISVTSAIVSIIGIPLLITFHSGDVPISGQAAVGSTAILAATGSTAALSFCFGPYVNQLKYVFVEKNHYDNDNDEVSVGQKKEKLVQATTTNIFGMEKVTIFDPEIDVSSVIPASNKRPFCNFMIRNEPFYIHPEMLNDEKLRVQLLGEDKLVVDDDTGKKSKKALDDDDTFL